MKKSDGSSAEERAEMIGGRMLLKELMQRIRKSAARMRHPLQTLQISEFYKVLESERKDLIPTRIAYIWRGTDYLLCRILLGINPYEYFRLLMYKKNWSYRRRCIGARRMKWIARRLNAHGTYRYLDNKTVFAQHWATFFGREFCSMQDCTCEAFCAIFRSCKKLIVKPVRGKGGTGIYTLKVEDNLPQIYEAIRAQKEPMIVEAYIAQDGKLHEMNPSSLNSIRVITVRDGENVDIAAATLRVGAAGELLDNLHANGVGYVIDTEKGIVCGGVDRCGMTYSVHPGSEYRVEGFRIERWEEVRTFCQAAHRHAPEGLNLIGWDVCLTEEKLYMIEGNGHPGFPPPYSETQNLWGNVKSYIKMRKQGHFEK